MKTIGWEVLSEEFAEIEEPDPEQGERQRQLINEFDEARAKWRKKRMRMSNPKVGENGLNQRKRLVGYIRST